MNAFSDPNQKGSQSGVGNSFSTHLSGDDDAMFAFMQNTMLHDALVPDIDVHSNFTVNNSDSWSYTASDGTKSDVSVMDITGSIKVDGFPLAESFVSDKNGNNVFLGVFATPENRGPVSHLPGDSQKDMINVGVRIVVDKDGKFLGILGQQDKKAGSYSLISIADWNKQFESTNTRGPRDNNLTTPGFSRNPYY